MAGENVIGEKSDFFEILEAGDRDDFWNLIKKEPDVCPLVKAEIVNNAISDTKGATNLVFEKLLDENDFTPENYWFFVTEFMGMKGISSLDEFLLYSADSGIIKEYDTFYNEKINNALEINGVKYILLEETDKDTFVETYIVYNGKKSRLLEYGGSHHVVLNNEKGNFLKTLETGEEKQFRDLFEGEDDYEFINYTCFIEAFEFQFKKRETGVEGATWLIYCDSGEIEKQ